MISNEEFEITATKEIKEEKLTPAFFARSPKTIKYAERPPRMGGVSKDIPIHEFAEKNGFKWVDSLLVTPQQRDAIWTNKIYPKQAIDYIEERLHNPLEHLVVANIPPAEIDGKVVDVGKGLFYSSDAPGALTKGTIIAIYAGKIRESMENLRDHYAMDLSDEDYLKQPSVINDLFLRPNVSGKDYGNVIRFAQDKPDELGLAKVKNLTPLELSNVATANLAVCPTVHYGCKITFLYALRDINPGEELAFPYGELWETTEFASNKRVITNINGTIIGYFSDNENITLLPSYQPSDNLEASRVKLDYENQAFFKKMILDPSFDSFDYQKRFIENVNYSLEIFLRSFDKVSETAKTIQTLQAVFNSTTEGTDEKYKALYTKFNEQKTFIKSKQSGLNNLISEISFHMNQYNNGKKVKNTSLKIPAIVKPEKTEITFQRDKLALNAQQEQKEKGANKEEMKPEPKSTREELRAKLKEKMKKRT